MVERNVGPRSNAAEAFFPLRHPGALCVFGDDGNLDLCTGAWSGDPSEIRVGQSWKSFIKVTDHDAFSAALSSALKNRGVQHVRARTMVEGKTIRAVWTMEAGADGRVCGVGVPQSPHDGQIATYRKSLESSPIGLLTIEEDGTIVFANHHLERLFGYETGELVGNKVESLVPARFREHHPSMRGKYLEAPAPRAMGDGRKLSGVRKDGSEFSIEIGLRPIVLEEGNLVVASVVDTTKRNQQEAELQARVAELQAHHQQVELLSEMNSLLQHAASKDEAVEVTQLLGQKLFANAEVALYTLSPSRDGLSLQATWGDWSPDVLLEPECCWAVRRTQPYVNKRHSLPLCSHFPGETTVTICIPMSAHGVPVGLIAMKTAGDTEKEILRATRTGQSVADQLALALSNIELRSELKSLAIRDPLTNLFNRRYLQDSIVRELGRAAREKTSVTAVMLDVDDFKLFNDTHGHQAADEVLRILGAVLRAETRGADIACRYGGEEFVLVLPNCELEDARRRVEALRGNLKRRALGVTLSAGLAEWPRDGEAWDDVLRRADRALYQAKRTGKDRAVSSGEVPGPPQSPIPLGAVCR